MRIFFAVLVSTLAIAQTHPSGLVKAYRKDWAPRLHPCSARFCVSRRSQGNGQAFLDQKIWLTRMAKGLGLRPGCRQSDGDRASSGQGAPVLGLVVHGDVQPVDNTDFPPFQGA